MRTDFSSVFGLIAEKSSHIFDYMRGEISLANTFFIV